MAQKGITKEIIINSAMALIEERGLSNFTLRELSGRLGIRVSSLYNHIKSQNELLMEVGLRAVDMLTELESTAISGVSEDSALFALADVYLSFACAHSELYRIIMGVHTMNIPLLESAVSKIADPIFTVIKSYGIDGDMSFHFQRMLRSLMHGFFSIQYDGGFSNNLVNQRESYHMAIGCLANEMKLNYNK